MIRFPSIYWGDRDPRTPVSRQRFPVRVVDVELGKPNRVPEIIAGMPDARLASTQAGPLPKGLSSEEKCGGLSV
jgi:hypothetical protein